MENEIEIKIMLIEQNRAVIQHWLSQLPTLSHKTIELGNTYYDSETHFFGQQLMGLRVRRENNHYEMTLKTQGEIVGGLHIRPEYNLTLKDATPDLKTLCQTFQLPFDYQQLPLFPVFSTDFTRQIYLISQNKSQIEIAFDFGTVKNRYGEEIICEIEFELKQGCIDDLFAVIQSLPQCDGMWLSSLSKAQRGYLVGNDDEIRRLVSQVAQMEKSFTQQQQIFDLIRADYTDERLLSLALQYNAFNISSLPEMAKILRSATQFKQELAELQRFSKENVQ